MSWLDTMKQRLQGANRFARSALAAECADRVQQVHERMWSGDYTPEVKRSIEIVRAFSQGTVVDQTEVASCAAELQNMVTYYFEEGISIVAETVTVCLRALHSIQPDEQEALLAAARALATARAVANLAEAEVRAVQPAVRKEGSAVAEEEDWQLKAVQVVQTWKGVAAAEMFEPLNDKPPKWLVEWEELVADAQG